MRALREDHARQTRVLRVIEELAPGLRADPEANRPILLEAMRFLHAYQHAWHHPREDRLFARIGGRDARFRAELRVLSREHVGGLRGVKALVDGLGRASIAQLRRSEGTRLARGLVGYVAHLREHVRHEERVFYAQAEAALDEADWQALAADPVPEDPLVDPARLAFEYPRLAGYLDRPVRVIASGGGTRGAERSAMPGAGRKVSFDDRAARLIELYGELLHDGLDLLRENLQRARSVRTPGDLWRVSAPICTHSGAYALSWFTRPARFARETAQDAAAAALSALRPASGKR